MWDECVEKIPLKSGEKRNWCDTCDSKKTTSLLEGARVLVRACVCVPMRVASREDSFRCCTTAASHARDKVVGQ